MTQTHFERAMAQYQRSETPAAKPTRAEVRNSGYSGSGASITRPGMTRDEWGDKSLDPWSDISRNLPLLRKNARSLYQCSGMARGAIERLVVYAIGTGLRLRSVPNIARLGISPEQARAIGDDLEARYAMHCNSLAADAQGVLLDDVKQQLLIRSWAMSGDVFTVRALTADDPRTLAARARAGAPLLQTRLIEADYCATPGLENDQRVSELARMQDGLEFDGNDRLSAYWFSNTHPLRGLSPVNGYRRVPAIGARSGMRLVSHTFMPERPSYFRGVPYLASVVEDFRKLQQYNRAEIEAALTNAIYTGVIYSESPDSVLYNMGDATESTRTVAEMSVEERADYYRGTVMGSGNIISLLNSDRMQALNNGRPNAAFDGFTRAHHMAIGAGLNMPRQVLAQDFDTSYTSARAALQSFWAWVKMVRALAVSTFNAVNYDEWLTLQVITGQIILPGYLDDPLARAAWQGAKWYGPSLPSLNPVDEAKAIQTMLACALTTHSQASIEFYGQDWDTVLPELVEENRRLSDAGMLLPAPNTAAQPAQGG